MEQLDINGETSADLANEETKDTTEETKKKKKGRKPKAAAATKEESKKNNGPATRTRGRLAAFLAQ